MEILVFFIVLVILVLVHELGHFIAAKKSGILVEEFGIGFPPRIVGIKKGETLYSINLLPIGGYVKLYGEEYHETEPDSLEKEIKYKDRAFVYKKPWQKSAVIVSGIVGNFLLGWILISFLFTRGVPTPVNYVIVEEVQKQSPAEKAGIYPKDTISMIKRNNKPIPIRTSNDLIAVSKKYAGDEIVLIVKRNGNTFPVKIIPRKTPSKGQGPLGIMITSFVEKKYAWYQAPFYGLTHSFAITKTILGELSRILFLTVTFQSPKVDVAGPIGIAQFTSKAFKTGFGALAELTALLSINLAIINILPFPALDGGRLMFVLYEWFTRKRVNKNVERYANLVGIIILLSLAVLISVRDIIKLYKN